jgi:hypothetical protein
MTPPARCAAPGCDNPVARRQGRTGRPPIYCSPTCRHRRPRAPLTVDIDQDPDDDGQPGRNWTVRLRRGPHTVTIGDHLGRFSAAALAHQLATLIDGGAGEVAP